MVVYTLANSKGGVGKTTSVFQIGHELASRGKRVLAFDGDTQLSLTKNMGIELKVAQPTMRAVLTDPINGLAHAIVPYTGPANRPISYPDGGCLHLVPGSKHITSAPAQFEKTRERQPVKAFELVVPWLLTNDAKEYQYVLLDPSPSSDQITNALMYAADFVIAPVPAEPMALDGVLELLDTLVESNKVRASLGLAGQVSLKGLLLSKVYPDQLEEMQALCRTLDENGIGHFGDLYIPYTTPGWKSPAERIPITIYQPNDAAAQAYREIAALL